MRYSLANYVLSIEPNDSRLKSMFGTISIGGDGSYLGSITLSRTTSLFTTQGYPTGGWVHSKNLDRTGTASLNLNQLSSIVAKLVKMLNVYYTGDYDGLTLSVSDTSGNKIASAIDCYITQIPAQVLGSSAQDQTWSFTCGQVNFN